MQRQQREEERINSAAMSAAVAQAEALGMTPVREIIYNVEGWWWRRGAWESIVPACYAAVLKQKQLETKDVLLENVPASLPFRVRHPSNINFCSCPSTIPTCYPVLHFWPALSTFGYRTSPHFLFSFVPPVNYRVHIQEELQQTIEQMNLYNQHHVVIYPGPRGDRKEQEMMEESKVGGINTDGEGRVYDEEDAAYLP